MSDFLRQPTLGPTKRRRCRGESQRKKSERKTEGAMNTRNFKSMLTAIALTIVAPLAMAADSPTPATHTPYTVLGVQLRSVLLADPANGSCVAEDRVRVV